MHVVTFYSFKGGVGRTMALVNSATELMLRGRRVLVVDFDLEAPGIQTYKPFANLKGTPGVVDYVTKYMEDGIAPNAAEYIIKREIDESAIWFMPAGKQDGDYARRLNSIEWLTLYRDFDGYLMFEDLKQQWKDLGFHYVLIDSRTGHTDVAGICTRQLPDATALMFFPNDQNLSGLEGVVRNIRAEGEGSRKKNIHLHFCPSNVPDLDDERQILARHLDDAMSRLSYKDPAVLIHHYPALDLLDQPVFVKDRPKTRLADEYRHLVDAIVAENLEDKAGALSKLHQFRELVRSSRHIQSFPEIEEVLGAIYKHHKDDGEVAWALSLVYGSLNNTEAELDTLSTAINDAKNGARARVRRAAILLRSGQVDTAKEDLRAIIMMMDIPPPDLTMALEMLRQVDPEWLAVAEKSQGLFSLRGHELNRIAAALMVDHRGTEFALKLLSADEADITTQNNYVLACIGAGRFPDAINFIGDRDKILRSDVVEDVFNLACAEWGLNNKPPQDLFSRALELFDAAGHREDVNFLQCGAMAHYVMGARPAAIEVLGRARDSLNAVPPTSIFSCWRYFYVRRQQFRADLADMTLQMERKQSLLPRWLEPKRALN
jgi:tetratricopeptide (TPR) repeat protein